MFTVCVKITSSDNSYFQTLADIASRIKQLCIDHEVDLNHKTFVMAALTKDRSWQDTPLFLFSKEIKDIDTLLMLKLYLPYEISFCDISSPTVLSLSACYDKLLAWHDMQQIPHNSNVTDHKITLELSRLLKKHGLKLPSRTNVLEQNLTYCIHLIELEIRNNARILD